MVIRHLTLYNVVEQYVERSLLWHDLIKISQIIHVKSPEIIFHFPTLHTNQSHQYKLSRWLGCSHWLGNYKTLFAVRNIGLCNSLPVSVVTYTIVTSLKAALALYLSWFATWTLQLQCSLSFGLWCAIPTFSVWMTFTITFYTVLMNVRVRKSAV